MSDLDERSKKILWVIVQSYIVFNGPIGSNTVSKMFPFRLSPATIRNTMANLEELGYLIQPHISAGRIPTDRGYRLYVNTLLGERCTSSFNKEFLQKLSDRLHSIKKDIDRLIEEASRTLSVFSHYLGVATPPRSEEITFKRIEFIKYKKNRALCILISEEGIVKNKAIDLEEMLSQTQLDNIAEYLNHEFTGLTLKDIKTKIISQMSMKKRVCDKLIADALRMCKNVITWESENLLYMSGISGTIYLPDFATIKQIKEIFRAIEDKHFMVKLLDKISGSDGVQVFIGSENRLSEMNELSLVVSTYNRYQRAIGTVGIIGPRRMDYEKVIPIVDHTAKTLTQILSEK